MSHEALEAPEWGVVAVCSPGPRGHLRQGHNCMAVTPLAGIREEMTERSITQVREGTVPPKLNTFNTSQVLVIHPPNERKPGITAWLVLQSDGKRGPSRSGVRDQPGWEPVEGLSDCTDP